MANKKMIWVKATARGQLPSRMWVDESSPPFQVEDGKESKRWMKKLTAAEAKKLTAELNDGADDGVSASDLAAVTEERDNLKAPPANSVAGAKKD